jgi:hypothetical protein
VDESGVPIIKTKIDGKDGAAKLADLVKSYQLQGHAENRARAVAEQEKALQTRMQEVEQHVKARVDHVEQLANVAGAELMREYQSDRLEFPTSSRSGAVRRIEQTSPTAKHRFKVSSSKSERSAVNKRSSSSSRRRKYLSDEAEKLPTVIPEWKDQATRAKESAEILEWGARRASPQNRCGTERVVCTSCRNRAAGNAL